MSQSLSLPPALLASPSFQIERVRRRTRDEVEAVLASQDTNMREFWVLTCIVEEDAASQTHLSDTLAIDASDMVRLIDALEKHGWASRERDPDDRRRQIIAPTKDGKKAQAKLAELVTAAEDRALDASTTKQLKHLKKLTKAILKDED
ncbi:MarR family winged helix-turn-helix transcriptional regulator [Corynebacterium cystitidis]|uniref:DNA-binding transcriptional regulator, MarR family n=1 Tax=Corynebacterium cystitidis DSM 20524 TaxID=1121357 RepID=A0A1H9V637_9CORY|nr:MarR family transcriptional regulator [Corynebacterium cystitidis]WJY83322.1 DNA-binding transcriptional repressor MarR [Corynebacterium cystitidis DSM 20524]SES17216.1 DNA-binding transcriptional regulator, MarR family [Corynebacterium cystitidis DSM 20524]SNV63295.1 transcriptional regulator [Corynebacterium cystitidis]